MKTINISFRIFSIVSMACLLAFASNPSQAINTKTAYSDMLDTCPTARFMVTNNGGPAGTPINFINQSSGANTYHWDFGDGTTSCAENPNHTYAQAGTYTVTLYAIIDGCTVDYIGTDDMIIY